MYHILHINVMLNFTRNDNHKTSVFDMISSHGNRLFRNSLSQNNKLVFVTAFEMSIICPSALSYYETCSR